MRVAVSALDSKNATHSTQHVDEKHTSYQYDAAKISWRARAMNLGVIPDSN